MIWLHKENEQGSNNNGFERKEKSKKAMLERVGNNPKNERGWNLKDQKTILICTVYGLQMQGQFARTKSIKTYRQ